jgi:transposase
MPRSQIVLFTQTLDDAVSDDHPVRLLDETLRACDWHLWEVEYQGVKGRPPIHPRVMASLILYGLLRRTRSSRMLEYMAGNNIDFMWLVEGLSVDHTTICIFRKKFAQRLKDLFRQVNKIALEAGMIQLLEMAIDGTRIKANASRFKKWTVAEAEKVLAELAAAFEKEMSEGEKIDAEEMSTLEFAEGNSGLSGDAGKIKARQALLQGIVEKLKQAEAERKKDGIDPEKKPAQIPKTDPDSKVMPNKEGGYAPNYTPVAATDSHSGMILDCDVINNPNEQNETLPAVDRVQEDLGKAPAAVQADGLFATSANIGGLAERGVEFYTPVESHLPQEGNPARRDDATQPVPESDWPRLPRNDKKKLAKSCFVYDAENDVYYCPMGKRMPYEETQRHQRQASVTEVRVYRSKHCAGCPLAASCLDPRCVNGRTVRRDKYELQREAISARMQTPEGKAVYKRRMHGAETPFGYIKAIMGVRQFLLRGLENVRTEWRWACLAYNLMKFINRTAKLRADAAVTATAAAT